MKNRYILTFTALLAAALLISACSQSEQPEPDTSSTSESTTPSAQAPEPEESATAAEQTTTADTDSTADAFSEQADGAVTVEASQDGTEQPWTETAVDTVMYVSSDSVSSFREALENSEKLNVYALNDELRIIARTDTGFYKTENGEYIPISQLSETLTALVTTSPDATIYTTTPAKE